MRAMAVVMEYALVALNNTCNDLYLLSLSFFSMTKESVNCEQMASSIRHNFLGKVFGATIIGLTFSRLSRG